MEKRETTLRTLSLTLILLLPLILYWPFVFGGKTIYWGTPLLQFWPWRTFAAEELRAGRLPLWNPYAGNGVPLLADHQSAILYPLNLIFWFLPVERAMGLSLVLHAVLAGAAMAALARDLQISRLGSLAAALAFMFSGYMVARGSFLTEVSALPWIPLLWLFGRRLVRKPSVANLSFLAATIALQFLAGHAQTWFYSLCSMSLLGLWEGGRWLAQRRASLRGAGRTSAPTSNSHTAHLVSQLVVRYLLLLAAVAWGIAIAGAQFLPTLELNQMAGRAQRQGWEAFALQYSFWPWRLITLLLPDFFGNPSLGSYWGYATYWEDAGYVGVMPFLCAAMAVLAWIRWRRCRSASPSSLDYVPFFAPLAVLALLMALGKNTPFYMLFFRYVPGFNAFQAPARWLCIYTSTVALLAGIGVDVLRPSHRLAYICRLGIAGAVALALTAFIGKQVLLSVKATFFVPLILFSIWFAVAMLLFLWGQGAPQQRSPQAMLPPDPAPGQSGRGARTGILPLHLPPAGDPHRRSLVFSAAVLLVIASDLILAGHSLNPAITAQFYGRRTQIGAFLSSDGPQGRFFYFADDWAQVMFGRYLDFHSYGPSDLQYWWGMRESLLPDLGMVEQLPSANTSEPLVESRYYALLQVVERMPSEAAMRVLGMMNVAYVLSPSSERTTEVAYRASTVTVYRNPYLLPRAYTLCRARVLDPKQAMHEIGSVDFDPTQEVILEPPALPQSAGCDWQPATVLRSVPNRVTIETSLPQPGYLVLADTFYPGWQAFVDGHRAEIMRANYAFRAVQLTEGEHQVVFEYRPGSFTAGVICSAAAVSMVVVARIAASYLGTRSRNRRAGLHANDHERPRKRGKP